MSSSEVGLWWEIRPGSSAGRGSCQGSVKFFLRTWKTVSLRSLPAQTSKKWCIKARNTMLVVFDDDWNYVFLIKEFRKKGCHGAPALNSRYRYKCLYKQGIKHESYPTLIKIPSHLKHVKTYRRWSRDVHKLLAMCFGVFSLNELKHLMDAKKNCSWKLWFKDI